MEKNLTVSDILETNPLLCYLLYMTSQERKQKIIEVISRSKSVQITQLTSLFNVSVMTIRRDLDDLEKNHYVKRVYGGAVLNEEELNKPYFPRAAINSSVKDLIAKKAVGLLKDGDTVILDLGSTVLQVSKHLNGIKDLSVITCSIPVINELEFYPNLRVYALGGELHRENHAFLGSETESAISMYCADIAFIGAAGVSMEYGLTNFYYPTASLCRKVIKQSKKIVLLADSSKFGKAKTAVVGNLSVVDVIITDTGIPQEYLLEFERLGVEVIQVENR